MYFWQNPVASLGENRRSSRVDEAIERSISHNEIVTITAGPEAIDELSVRADDIVRVEPMFWEFWGTENGEPWRVHVRVKR